LKLSGFYGKLKKDEGEKKPCHIESKEETSKEDVGARLCPGVVTWEAAFAF
jgi:hypothetical protein